MSISSYIENISKRYSLGNATEHTFRGDLQQLLESLVPDIAATNEPKRIDCGAPDYVLTRKDIPVGYIEAKDIGVDLGGTVIKEQRERYVEALDNLIFTDYLEFRFFLDGTATERIRIGEVRGNKIVGFPDEFERFESLIKEFCFRTPQSIRSSKRLAEMMADKAKLLAYVIKNALDSDEETQENSTLKEQLHAFRQVLIHDIDSKQFSDVYAQTIAYGMFAARIHDSDLETFTRQEAAERIPKTNPFLRKLFQYIAGYDLDDRIRWIVDSLADVFRAADVAAILKNFGRSTQTHDPIIHFYETFLAEYDPKLRKSRGVYYTPEPVVDFIVRAVDEILKTEFGLPAGLADTSKVKVKEKTPVVKKGKGTVYEEVEKEYHKVQILDPATGTGTFLAQVIKQIYKSFENQKGIWPQYVEEHLIPRLNGFELLMASYAMAHLKLDLLLTELSEDTSLKGTNELAQGKAEGRHPGNDANTATDPEGVEQRAADVAPLQGANANTDISPGFHPGLLSSSPSATGTFAPIDILDYIYGVLHSPSYREKYKEFLKIDFPRVPYPKDAETFWQLVALGGELRQIHLLESPRVEEFITGYPVGGSNEVVKPRFVSDENNLNAESAEHAEISLENPALRSGRVYINDTQYFSGVPEVAWNFYIGGYQPAQKWLKDRKGRTLSYDDIRHYQKIIVALTETDRIMKEIDKIDFIDPA